MKTYSEKLRDPRWQKKRLEIMQRDDFACRECSSSIKQLQIHHLFYLPKKMPWEYPDESLITFCNDCHNEITLRNAAYMMQSPTPFLMMVNTRLLELSNESERQSGLVMELAYALSQVRSKSDFEVLQHVHNCIGEMLDSSNLGGLK